MTVFAPLLAAAVAKLSAHTLVLEGEVAIYDLELRSRFEWLREPDPRRRRLAASPDGIRPPVLRPPRPHGAPTARSPRPVWSTSGASWFPVRRLAPDGIEAWAQVVERGYEGLVAKDEASLYEAGPTRRWLKVKQKGWTDAEDRWQRRISTARNI
jgi:ATP-dependent DNA ligase